MEPILLKLHLQTALRYLTATLTVLQCQSHILQEIVSATGTANSGTTISSNQWVGCIATFKAAYNVLSTTTALSTISTTPLTPGQTGVSFSGSVSSSGTAVPSGEPVVLQYSTSSSGPWTTAASVTTGTGW